MEVDGRIGLGSIGSMTVDRSETVIGTTFQDQSWTQSWSRRLDEKRWSSGNTRFNVKVPVQESWDQTGKGPIGVRWVEPNKGDEVNPDSRSR